MDKAVPELFESGWKRALADEFGKPYFARLVSFVADARTKGLVYPPDSLVFSAFERTPFESVRVVILGQDPYHEPGQAQGLAFYVPETVKCPPSLRNIAKELASDLGGDGSVPDLLEWADSGVLLLNATLTVADGLAGSHQGKGWETFTDAAVHALADRRDGLVFILWGAHAQKKGAFIDRTRHLVIESAHPSPLSARRGFFGSRPFSRTNEYLRKRGLPPIFRSVSDEKPFQIIQTTLKLSLLAGFSLASFV